MATIRLASTTGESIHVDLQRGIGNAFVARIGDDAVEGSFEAATPASGVIRLGDRVVPCYFARKDSRIEVWVGGETHAFELVSAKGRSAVAAAGPLAQEILAPMPGTVLRIDVRAGDTFAAHQPLIIMESMKMEMTLSAPHAGRVAHVSCTVGELVPMGKVLAKLQAMENDAHVRVKS